MTPKEPVSQMPQTNAISYELTPEQSDMVVKNLNLVHHILHKHGIHQNCSEYEDYFQEGSMGLILAAQRFDPNKGFTFATFACSYIYGSIHRYMRDHQNIIRLPRKVWEALGKVKKESQDPTAKELSELSELSNAEFQFAFNALHPSSLNVNIGDLHPNLNNGSHPVQLQDVIPDNSYNLENIVCDEDNIQWAIEQVINSLKSELHRAVWEEFIYGAMYNDIPNQIELAHKYKISQAQVSRVIRKCLQDFLKALNA